MVELLEIARADAEHPKTAIGQEMALAKKVFTTLGNCCISIFGGEKFTTEFERKAEEYDKFLKKRVPVIKKAILEGVTFENAVKDDAVVQRAIEKYRDYGLNFSNSDCGESFLLCFYRKARSYYKVIDRADAVLRTEFDRCIKQIPPNELRTLQESKKREIELALAPYDLSEAAKNKYIEKATRQAAILAAARYLSKSEINGLNKEKRAAWDEFSDCFDPHNEWFNVKDSVYDTAIDTVARMPYFAAYIEGVGIFRAIIIKPFQYWLLRSLRRTELPHTVARNSADVVESITGGF